MKTLKTEKSQSSNLAKAKLPMPTIANTQRLHRHINAARLRLASPKPRSVKAKLALATLALIVPLIVPLMFLLLPLAAAAQQTEPAIALPEGVGATPNDLYRIGAGDVLEMRVLNRPQLSRDAVRVDNRGMIRMPMIDGEIRAGCRTESELSEEVARLYLRYQRHPQVDVFIKEFSSKPVAVIGAVEKPGQFQLQRRVRLLELVSLAGGPTERAGQRILVAHSTEMSPCDESPAMSTDGFESYDLNNTLKADGVANPYVRSGDIITVPEAQQVFVVGNVFRPASIPLKERVTVSQAVAMAGGTMPDSRVDRIRVLRQSPGGLSKTEIVVDLAAISKRKADDIELQPNDIVEVPTSTGKRILRTIISAVAPSASSLPLRIVH